MLQHNPRKTPRAAHDVLDKDMSLKELSATLEEMANNKAPGLDGLIMECFATCWHFIYKQNYFTMVQDVFTLGRFSNGVIKGLTILLHKGDTKEDLTNWWPITLLNVEYKIYVKALQQRLHHSFPRWLIATNSSFYLLDTHLTISSSHIKQFNGQRNQEMFCTL